MLMMAVIVVAVIVTLIVGCISGIDSRHTTNLPDVVMLIQCFTLFVKRHVPAIADHASCGSSFSGVFAGGAPSGVPGGT